MAPTRPALRNLGRPSLRDSATGKSRRSADEEPRVLLFVPPYTRLIEPAPSGSAFSNIGIDTFEVMKRAGTPIGLLRIATNARRAGYKVQIVDCPFVGWSQEGDFIDLDPGKLNRYGLRDDQIRSIIEAFDPDVVGIQCNYTVQWGNARALADLVKDLSSRRIPSRATSSSLSRCKCLKVHSRYFFEESFRYVRSRY